MMGADRAARLGGQERSRERKKSSVARADSSGHRMAARVGPAKPARHVGRPARIPDDRARRGSIRLLVPALIPSVAPGTLVARNHRKTALDARLEKPIS